MQACTAPELCRERVQSTGRTGRPHDLGSVDRRVGDGWGSVGRADHTVMRRKMKKKME